MTKDEFNAVITQINDAYPRKSYSFDQLGRLFSEVRALSKRAFQDAVVQLLDNSSFHPTVHAVRQACAAPLNKIRSDNRKFSPCGFCYGNGQYDLVEKLKASEAKFAIACPYCDAADARGLSLDAFPRLGVGDFEKRDLRRIAQQKHSGHIKSETDKLMQDAMSNVIKLKPTFVSDDFDGI